MWFLNRKRIKETVGRIAAVEKHITVKVFSYNTEIFQHHPSVLMARSNIQTLKSSSQGYPEDL
jgi:hypothetical protein